MKVNFSCNKNIVNKIKLQNKKINKNVKNFSKTTDSKNWYNYPINYYSNNIAFKGKSPENSFNFNIAGYDKEKEKVINSFITPVLKEKSSQQEQSIPAAILLHSQDEAESKNFINALADISDMNIVEVFANSDDYAYVIKNKLTEAKQKYTNTGKRTMLIIRNSDEILNNSLVNKSNVILTKNFIKDCSKLPNEDTTNASAATFVFETEYPSDMSPEILNKNTVSFAISIPYRSQKDIKELLKHFLCS